ncbi:hypothetical protein Salat_0446700 [Sesamum alatum]|uniref:Uncharacterized protein n=1 Tax=Sesamum alatum TaxID=300844 RepID=A0AAE1Z459_9LAMI|nr:hypothetical protein Salat_0446700 [Sesamum alatum]
MEQLGQKLLCTTLELEKLKAEAMEEMRKNKEHVKQLIHLLKFAIHERDEARNQLQNLLTTNTTTTIPRFRPDSPLPRPARANSSITESNSLSETHNYGSPPVESLFDAVSSPPEIFSSMELAPKIDQGSFVIDGLVKGRALPQKGKFLEAVLEAGPLLQTLLVAGPLPRWRNPPRLQPFQIPPVSIKAEVFADQKPVVDVGRWASRPLNSQSYALTSCGSSSGYTSNFASVGSGTCLSNASMISSNDCFRLVKRQKFC